MKKVSLEEKLYTLKFRPDIYSHLKPEEKLCEKCTNRVCETLCPAHVYEWDNVNKKMTVSFENCLECGACRIACPEHAIEWSYPRGTKGVTIKNG